MLSTIGAMMLLAGTGWCNQEDGRCYELRTYYAHQGSLEELNARFRDSACGLFEKHGMRSHGFWVPRQNPENQLVYLLSYPNRKARDQAWRSLIADPEWKKVCRSAVGKGGLLRKVENLFLRTAVFSPVVPETLPTTKGGALQELRIRTITSEMMNDLAGTYPEQLARLFKKHGVQHWCCWTPVSGQEGSGMTLIYLLSSEDPQTARNSMDAVFQDPEWLAVKRETEKRVGGAITPPNGIVATLMVPTDYSAKL